MDELCVYEIEVKGPASEEDVNAMSPLAITMVRAREANVYRLRTDQSGLIGLLRHLHGHGLVLLSVRRV